MGPILPPTNLDVLLLMGRVPGSSGVAASRYEFILIFLCPLKCAFPRALETAIFVRNTRVPWAGHIGALGTCEVHGCL